MRILQHLTQYRHRIARACKVGGIVVIVALAFIPQANTGPADAEPAAAPHITIANGKVEERRMALWAVERMEAAGLELPAMAISFHDDTDPCDGFIGLYSASRAQLFVCNRGGDRTEPRHTILHELAHAWSFARLSADEIGHFTEGRGLAHWTNPLGSWWQQGAEQMAEIVAWGVQDPADPFRSVWIHTETCADLAIWFQAVTGSDPLNDSQMFCK